MRYSRLLIISMFVMLTYVVGGSGVQAQQPPGSVIPSVQIPPITVPGVTIPPIVIPPIVIPPIPVPEVNVPGTPSQPPVLLNLPPAVQAILSCVESGGTSLSITACIAESQGQSSAAQTLRRIDTCVEDDASGVETAACIAEAVGQEEAARILRAIDACQTAGGSNDEVTACIAEALGIDAEQVEVVTSCRASSSVSSRSSTTTSSSASSTAGSSSSSSSVSSVSVATCVSEAVGDDETARAVLGCFPEEGAEESTTGAELVACVVDTVSSDDGAVVERLFACIEAHREDGDLQGFLDCVIAATDG